VAVSADGSRWSILNASPDLRAQIFSFPELLTKSRVRGSAIDAVLLSDAELDHITGLLSLREAQPIRLFCTQQVFEWVFANNPIFAALNQPERFNVMRVEDRKVETVGCGLGFEAIFVSGKVPTYVEAPTANRDGAAVAYKLIDNRAASSLMYVPAIKEIDERFIAAAAECDWVTSLSRDLPAVWRGSAIFRSEKSTLTPTTPIRFSMRPRRSAVRSKEPAGESPKTAWILRYDSKRERYDGKT
jgi:pyrroloquinoline quinone biosynthesis protein B